MLVTGPTGSGKSTTLYAALNHLRKPEVNIVTVEDPVEYVLPGVNQVHVNTKTGLTFASCLRSILRQDPNVIMVGEIRDKETAEIAMKAAQTGHLVLSTLHTNDSVAAVTRLLDLGIPPFMISSSITAIMAQRLVRRLCTCKGTEEPTVANLERMEQLGQVDPVSTIFVPRGCELCELTGYRGRVGIYEILPFDETIRDAVRTGVRNEDIRNHMRDIGMKLMQEDALDKIITGMTSIEEITRVVPVHTGSFPECAQCGRRISPTFQFCPHCGVKRKGSASSCASSRHPPHVGAQTKRPWKEHSNRDLSHENCSLRSNKKVASLLESERSLAHLRRTQRRVSYSSAGHQPNGDVHQYRRRFSRRRNLESQFPSRKIKSSNQCSLRSSLLPAGVGVGVEFIDMSNEDQKAIAKETHTPGLSFKLQGKPSMKMRPLSKKEINANKKEEPRTRKKPAPRRKKR